MKNRRRKLGCLLATPVVLYVLAVAISNGLSGCTSAPHPLQPRSAHGIGPPQLRIVSYNVNYEVSPSLSADALEKADADVVCLQECTPAWEQYLRPRVSAKYPHMIFHHEPYAGGVAILSRYPMKELLYEIPPAGWLPGLGVRVETEIGALKLLNVHLRPAAAGNGGHWNYFLLPKVHPKEIEHLYKRLQSDGESLPTIVLGDFNESDDGNAMKYLRQQKMADALGQYDSATKTWHGKLVGISLSERCDHILHSSQLRCIDSAVLVQGASDHFPVVAVFEKMDK